MSLVISGILLLIAGIFFLTSWLTKQTPNQENTFVGLFGIFTVSCCIIYQRVYGFISIYEIFNSISYMILMYAGITRTRSVLYKNGQKEAARKLLYQFIFISYLFMIINLIWTQGVIITGSNKPMITVFFACPLYTSAIFLINILCIKKYKLYRHAESDKFEWSKFITSFITVSWLISLYEWVDLFLLLKDFAIYQDATKVYPDPTFKTDIAWLMFCIVFLLVFPRVKYAIKNKSKGDL